jgi:hypothetical protein
MNTTPVDTLAKEKRREFERKNTMKAAKTGVLFSNLLLLSSLLCFAL